MRIINKVVFAVLSVSLLIGCSGINESTCPDMMCTLDFRMIQVKFLDTTGRPVAVEDFSATVKRTGRSTKTDNDFAVSGGNYTVASDADVRDLAESGEEIVVSATHPGTGKKVSAEFVVSGGKCACHVAKISGPSQVVF